MLPKFEATERYALIEVQVPANLTGVITPINDQPYLRSDSNQDIAIQAIETYTVSDIAISPLGAAVVSEVNLAKSYLKLYVDGLNYIDLVPLIRLRNTDTNSAATPFSWNQFRLKNLQVIWDKCTIVAGSQYNGGANTAFSFLLGVHFIRLLPGTLGNIAKAESNHLINMIQGNR
jgi:hypothetical protein